MGETTMSKEDEQLAAEWADAPFVCPGCHAVGGERCAGYCPDAAIEAERERNSDRYFDSDSILDEVDDLLYQPDTEPAPDDGGDDIVQSIAILEAALAAQDETGPALGRVIATLDELAKVDSHPGARSCAGCRELVLDDFDHDFCGPEEPTEVMAHTRPRTEVLN